MARPPLVLAAGLAALVWLAPFAGALEPPTAEQVGRYRSDGSLSARAAAARAIGNHRVSPVLARRFRDRLQPDLASTAARPPATARVLPSTGTRRIFALLIAFPEYPGHSPRSDIDWRLFGSGPDAEVPYESLRDFYRRSSYGQLELQGATLGWHVHPSPRSSVEQTDAGREALIRQAIEHFDRLGHDFSQYDSDGDGAVDYFLVFWTGPHQEWAEFWWGYERSYQDQGFVVDGTRLGEYSWQWESWDDHGPFSPRVAIHETGHALGLPDYYDYDDSIGPRGGLGGLDMMDANWGDHTCFSKLLLGWLTPEIVNQGQHDLELDPSEDAADAVLLMHGEVRTDPYGEHFMAQHRRRRGNDVDYPQDGLLIWHVDASLTDRGDFRFDNSYTEHKLLRLMEADGLEEIERGLPADADDFYRPGSRFADWTSPDSDRYDGAPTHLEVDAISLVGSRMRLRADLGSGCALFCEASVAPTAWPGLPAGFSADARASNCQGSADLAWQFGDGAGSALPDAAHGYGHEGLFPWRLEATLGDAECGRRGEILVCQDERCWQWRAGPPMAGARVMHAGVSLDDGRVLVAGGEATPEVYDPVTGRWTSTGPISGRFFFAQGVLLEDGRVLVVGSTPDDPVDAELYDPVSDSWRVVGPLGRRRTFHSLRRLSDGRVMVAGGYFWDAQGRVQNVLEVEIFDPETELWRDVGSLAAGALLPGLSRLPDGRLLVTGDQAAQLFDPSTDGWSRTADLTFPRQYHVAAGLPDGRVLVAGGFLSRSAEIFDPATGSWSLTAPMTGFRNAAAVTTDSAGRVHLTGGFDRDSTVIATSEVFDPATGTWLETAPMSRPRLAHQASPLPDGTVLVTGGMTTLEVEPYVGTDDIEILAPPEVGARPRHADRRVLPTPP